MAGHETFPLVEQDMSVTISFRINDVEDLLAHSTPSKSTAYFHPGYYLDVYSCRDESTGKGRISIFLKPQPGNTRLPVRLELSAWSLARTTQYKRGNFRQWYIYQARGWRDFIVQDDYDKYETMRHENAILLEAKITCNLTPRKAHKPSLDIVHGHITERKPKREVTYVAYSGKILTGRLCHPRTLYSSLDILEAKGIDVSKLETTSLALVKDGTNERRRPALSPEGFAEDSDFEECSEDVDEDVKNGIALTASGSMSKIQTDNDPSINDNEISSPPKEEREETVTITGAAADTWEAFLFWLYTGHIVFAPMKNDGAAVRRHSINMHRTNHPRRPAPCSCKSIFHIASKLDIDPLKQLALRHLENVLTEKTVLKELFTPFTAKHEKIKAMEVVAVVKHWNTIRDSQTLKDKMDEIAEGKLPHAGKIMADLLLRAALTKKPRSPA